MHRLSVHTMTTRPLSLEQCVEQFSQRGIAGISVWRQALEGHSLGSVGRLISDAGLQVVSLCRGGFFPASTPAARQAAVDDNLWAIEQAAVIGAPLVVLVCGAVPGMSLLEARKQIAAGIAEVLPVAAQAGVKLAIEPLHPVYADNRSAVNTMRQAQQICDELASPWLGIAVDVYHVWWDAELEQQIQLAGQKQRLFAFHICDWLTPTQDVLNDRGLMGEGCIDIHLISEWMEQSGFVGFREVEIFSNRWWAMDQSQFLDSIVSSYSRLYCH